MFNQQPTPKAVNVLQKLLSQNPIKQDKSLQRSSQNNSGSQQLRSSLTKIHYDYKNELLSVLKKTDVTKKPLLKRTGNSLNSLLQVQKPIKQLSGRDDYKKRRPPELQHLGEDIQPQIQSAKNQSSSKGAKPGFYTSKNVFNSLNEILKNYIQNKSLKQAGTGEGIKICQSARNADRENKQLFHSENKRPIQDNTEILQNLYLKTAKILTAFKTKEMQWKTQKHSLRNELKFLKQLLRLQEENRSPK